MRRNTDWIKAQRHLRTRLLFSLALAVLLFLGESPVGWAAGIAYNVTSTGDGDNVGPNTSCDDGTGHCTLRAAIQAANSHAGDDAIFFGIPITDPGYNTQTGTWTINLPRQLPNISSNIAINGPGAAQLIVKANADSNNPFRVFNVTATGMVTFSGITVSGGALPLSGAGGGIQNVNEATVNISDCVIGGNFALSTGGGVQNSSTGILNINGTTFIGNQTVGSGGAIANSSGTITASNCLFSGNTGAGAGSQGGAVYNATGKVTVMNSTFSGNSAGKGGAIMEDQPGGAVTLVNCTFSGNSSTSNGGAAISLANGTINLSNCTVAANTHLNSPGGGAGGVYCLSPGVVNVKNTLIALNTATGMTPTPDVQGPFTSQGFNLIGKADGSTGFTGPGDQTGTIASPLDPKLDPNGLQDNGGPTRTIALLFGSPAIDKATAGINPTTGMPLTTDQRGTRFARTFNDPNLPNAAAGGDGTDIGAFEVQPSVLANVATRLKVETGDNVLFGGFIVTGAQPKKVIVRALGPSLQAPGVLADPTLELYQGNTLLETNNNWVDSPNKQAIIDSTAQPPNDLESAIVRSLPANGTIYTAIVRGAGNGTGIGIVEIYDLDSSVNSKLANISTRGLVQTGDNILIAGTIVVGQAAQNVLICALGPSTGVPGNLADPTLELRDGSGTLLEANDNWVDSPNKQAIIDTGAAPTNNLESAIIHTLPANNAIYTALVRGANNGTGVAVVEVFALN